MSSIRNDKTTQGEQYAFEILQKSDSKIILSCLAWFQIPFVLINLIRNVSSALSTLCLNYLGLSQLVTQAPINKRSLKTVLQERKTEDVKTALQHLAKEIGYQLLDVLC